MVLCFALDEPRVERSFQKPGIWFPAYRMMPMEREDTDEKINDVRWASGDEVSIASFLK